MNSITSTGRDDAIVTSDAYTTHVAWGAIIGGACAAAAVSLILLILGSALGLSSMSPWSSSSDSATMATLKTVRNTAIWLIVMQWIASGFGGYLTGRLRHKWQVLHTEEIFFRDTAHGFLAWAVATLLTATILTSAASSIIGTGIQAASTVGAGAAMGAAHGPAPHGDRFEETNGYYIDSLFRPMNPSATTDSKDARAETTRILATDLKDGTVNDNDKAYLAQVIAARTGLSQADASKRVDDTINQITANKEKLKETAEQARKTAMHVSIYMFLSLLIGAFIASAASALGGRHRDQY